MKVVDARGTLCPQPIINLALAAKDCGAGEVITLLSDDPATWPDLQAWARMTARSAVQCDTETFEITL
jgi:tRNA 2-thiouridine synthesizing protein A